MLISVYTFWILFFDFLRLMAYLLFDVFSFNPTLLSACSNFHLAWDLLFLFFLSPFLSFYVLWVIVDPVSVCYFLRWNFEMTGDVILSRCCLFVVDSRGCWFLAVLWETPFFSGFLLFELILRIVAYFLSSSLDVIIFSLISVANLLSIYLLALVDFMAWLCEY